MKVTLLAFGSTGDVRPMIMLGRELQSRGHVATIATFSNFEEMVTKAGLGFFPIAGDASDLINKLMSPTAKGAGILINMERSLKGVAPVLLRDVLESCRDADAMCCTFFGNLFYSVADHFKIPVMQVNYFVVDPNNLTPIANAPGRHLGKNWAMTTYAIAYLLISMVEKRFLTEWRNENGMPQPKLRTKPDYKLGENTIPVIYAASSQLMKRPDNWGDNIYQSGFWWDENPGDFTPPQELQDFLASGDKPVYIGFGSMNSGNMNRTYAMVMRAIRAAGVRAIVDLGWNADRFDWKSNSRIYFNRGFLPHDWLFPRVRAVAHHGGAGTTASGLRYGRPTLVIPFGGDQPYWGEQVYNAGCGPKPVSRDTMTVTRLTKALIDLTRQAKYRENAARVGEIMQQEHGVIRAADILEKTVAEWKKD